MQAFICGNMSSFYQIKRAEVFVSEWLMMRQIASKNSSMCSVLQKFKAYDRQRMKYFLKWQERPYFLLNESTDLEISKKLRKLQSSSVWRTHSKPSYLSTPIYRTNCRNPSSLMKAIVFSGFRLDWVSKQSQLRFLQSWQRTYKSSQSELLICYYFFLIFGRPECFSGSGLWLAWSLKSGCLSLTCIQRAAQEPQALGQGVAGQRWFFKICQFLLLKIRGWPLGCFVFRRDMFENQNNIADVRKRALIFGNRQRVL